MITNLQSLFSSKLRLRKAKTVSVFGQLQKKGFYKSRKKEKNSKAKIKEKIYKQIQRTVQCKIYEWERLDSETWNWIDEFSIDEKLCEFDCRNLNRIFRATIGLTPHLCLCILSLFLSLPSVSILWRRMAMSVKERMSGVYLISLNRHSNNLHICTYIYI